MTGFFFKKSIRKYHTYIDRMHACTMPTMLCIAIIVRVGRSIKVIKSVVIFADRRIVYEGKSIR